MGAAEAPCFPANSRILVSWFPQRERARANSVYSIGMYFGIAFLSPLLFWVTAPSAGGTCSSPPACLGVLFGLVWWRSTASPHASKWANQAELDEIAAGGGIDLTRPPRPRSRGRTSAGC
jgi:ACS family D-galactonate transporter-like MFS transporter